MTLLRELKRRKVFRVTPAYVVVGWLLIQVATQVFPFFELPNWSVRLIVLTILAGFPIALVLAWAFDATPKGIERTDPPSWRSHRSAIAVGLIGVLIAALAGYTWWHSQRTPAVASSAGAMPSAAVAASVAADAPVKSIAVLPFVNMSSDKEQEYFSAGISEEVLNLLTKIPQLQVTARTSSFSFKGKEVAIPEIARTLHVAHVLEGSVRKSGNSVRITAQLIKAGTDTHLWSQTCDRKLDDIFAIQDEIAADVVKQLKVTLLGAAPKARTTDLEAYALYLQAVQLGRQFTAEAFKQSERCCARC